MAAKAGTEPINAEATANAAAAIPAESHRTMAKKTFQMLADPTRLRILYALQEQSLCVRDIAIVVGIWESTVLHQLRRLRDQHIVKTRRDVNIISYTLDDQHVAALLREATSPAQRVIGTFFRHIMRTPS